MRLLFIHGINQEQYSAETLRLNWRQLLIDHAVVPECFTSADTRMAYYANILAEAATFDVIGGLTFQQIIDGAYEAAFVAEGLREICDLPLAAALTAGVAGDPLGGLSLELENPLELARRILREATVYFTDADVRDRIDEQVRAQLTPAISGANRFIIVCHSLGTVIAFKLLRALSQAQAAMAPDDPCRISVPLLVTVGSPLPIGVVRRALGAPLERPAVVDQWWNFYDPADLIALGRGLTPPHFAAGITNDGTVHNSSFASHQIKGYLAHGKLISVLETALTAG
jgi:hypothetical protein